MNTNSTTNLEAAGSVLQTALDFIHSLYGLPGYALVLLTCIIFGYVLKIMAWFPNQRIPTFVIFWGMTWNLLLADWTPGTSVRLWIGRNLLIGMIVGFAAWALHNRLLKRFESSIPLLGRLLPPTGNTETFTKPPA